VVPSTSISNLPPPSAYFLGSGSGLIVSLKEPFRSIMMAMDSKDCQCL
jgi:hypothetical protein